MSLRLTEQERTNLVERSKRDIFGSYAHAFAPPRIRNLADKLTNLDTLAACGLAGEIDAAIGSVASEKLLSALEHAADSSAITQPKRGSKK